MILTRKILEELVGRLERRIDQLDEHIAARLSLQDDRGRRTEEQLAELREKQGMDAAEAAALQQRNATNVVAEIQRLDAQVRESKTDAATIRADIAELRKRQDSSAAELDELQQRHAAELTAEIQRLDLVLRATKTDAIATQQQLVITAGLAEQIFALTSRLDSDVVAGFATHNKRLETDLVILSERDHQLGVGVSQLSELVQRLDLKVEEGLTGAANQDQFSQLTEVARSLDNKMTECAALGRRLETDVAAAVQQSRELSDALSGLTSFIQRLDNNVAEQLTGVGKRMDADLVLLADRTRHLESTLNENLPRVIDHIKNSALNNYGLGAVSDETAEAVQLNFPACLKKEFPQDFDAAWAATNTIVDAIAGSDLTQLALHSPGMINFDSPNYLRLSAIRMVRLGAALRASDLRKGKILDFGSYFGNFALFAKQLGFQVDAADQYGAYGKAFSNVLPLLRSAGIRTIDLGHGGNSDLSRIAEGLYDVVICLSVIEHVAHTPKPLLLALNRVLRPGGTLILDTPNLSYVYTREKLASGEPIGAAIQDQFNVEPPFEGHHREYTSEELVWMLQQIGHSDIHVEMFNYSIYELPELRGRDAERFRRMERDPQLREMIMTRSRKPLLAKINEKTNSPRPRRPSPRALSGPKRP